MDAPSLHIQTLYIRGAAAIRVQGYFKIDSRRANTKRKYRSAASEARIQVTTKCQPAAVAGAYPDKSEGRQFEAPLTDIPLARDWRNMARELMSDATNLLLS